MHQLFFCSSAIVTQVLWITNCSFLKEKTMLQFHPLQNVFYVLCWFSNHFVLDKKTNISLVLLSLGSAERDIKWGGKVNSHLMASCLRNIRTKNYEDLLILLEVTVENVGDVFFGTQCMLLVCGSFTEAFIWKIWSCFTQRYRTGSMTFTSTSARWCNCRWSSPSWCKCRTPRCPSSPTWTLSTLSEYVLLSGPYLVSSVYNTFWTYIFMSVYVARLENDRQKVQGWKMQD